ncbi:LuxR C-terminal-related transcriptional regulator [Microvirga sp. 2TAF3]|uniref:LuxR C-terminal-related transcriptional regulator n=1 Tax=Microvirga sp. 2TAF3 TaxID=3233014 RepID=UPI003F9C8F0D
MEASSRIGLIADNDGYFRIALGVILTRQLGFSGVIEVTSLDEALECLGDNPNIWATLLDLSMPGMRTSANLRAVRECSPRSRMVVIADSTSRRDILLALEAGVHGYVPKSLGVSELTNALRTIFDGNIYVPPLLAEVPPASEEMVPESAPPAPPAKAETASPLTPRQQDVLDLLVQGKTNKEIAYALKLGEGTVKIHMSALFRYFGVNNRAAAAVAGARPYPNRRRPPSGA